MSHTQISAIDIARSKGHILVDHQGFAMVSLEYSLNPKKSAKPKK